MAALLRASEVTSRAKEGQTFASEDVRYKNKAGKDTSNILEIVEKRAGFKLGILSQSILCRHFTPLEEDVKRYNITQLSRLGSSDKKGVMWCRTCAAYHTRSHPKEVLILLSDSQLNGVHWPSKIRSTLKDSVHIEYLCRSGRSIPELTSSLVEFYAHVQEPLKVCVHAGYNDIMAGRTTDEVLSSLWNLKWVLNELDACHRRPRDSSQIVFSTLVNAPKLYLRLGEQVDKTNPSFTKEGQRIAGLNKRIINLNGAVGYSIVKSPLCESIGRRTATSKSGKKTYSLQEKWFRESRPESMLHVADMHRPTLLTKMHRTLLLMARRSSLLIPGNTDKKKTSKSLPPRRYDDMRLMILEGREKAREEFKRYEEKILENLRKIPSERDYNASTSGPDLNKGNSANYSNRSGGRSGSGSGFEPTYSSTPRKKEGRTERRFSTTKSSRTTSRNVDWSTSRRTSSRSDGAKGGRSSQGERSTRRSSPRLKSTVHIPRRITRSMLD